MGIVTSAAPADVPLRLRAPVQVARNFNRSPALANKEVAAAPDDFIWIASDEGVFRFDGTHFHLLDGDPADHIAVTADGWVWVGSGQGLLAFRQGLRRRLLSEPVTSIVSRGNKIVVSAKQIWRGTLDGLSPVNAQANGPLSVDGLGRVWFGCGDAVCVLGENGNLERLGREQGVPQNTWLIAIADDADRLWAWNQQTFISVKARKVSVWADSVRKPPQDGRLQAIRTSQGRIWLPGPQWIEDGALVGGDRTSSFGWRSSLTKDRNERVWVGSEDRGLDLLAPGLKAQVWRGEDFLAGSESVVRTRSGKLLAASTAEGVLAFDPKSQTWMRLNGPLGMGHAWGVVEGASGDIWGIIQNAGIYKANPKTGKSESIFRGSMNGIEFRTLLRDHAGQIWVGAKRGLYAVQETSPPRLSEIRLPGDFGYAGAFAIGPDGQEWLGYEGGIARLEAGTWKLVIPYPSLLSQRIRSISVASGPVFWISYRAKLPFSMVYREGGSWKRRDFSAEQGYQPAETTNILADRRGWVWRGSEEGLFVSDGRHLAPQDWIHFDHTNSLASNSVSPFGLFEDRDGSIWASTSEGVSRINPDSAWFTRSESISEPRVTAIRQGEKEYLWLKAGDEFPLVEAPVELDFAQWPETLPRQPLLRYRLWPKEKDWKTTVQTTLRYDHLPPGNYRFDLQQSPDSVVHPYAFRIRGTGFSRWGWPAGGFCAVVAVGLLAWRASRKSKLKREYLDAKQIFLKRESSDSDHWLRIGEMVADRYLLEERIGDGGFANVYRAKDTQTNDIVAIKILRPQGEFLDWQRKRFEREIESLRRIDHPGVVRMLDSGWIAENEPFVVMSYVTGPTLRNVLISTRPTQDQVCNWIREIGAAAGEVHAHAVLHRDLKPENVLIQDLGKATERVVLVDFGAATVTESTGLTGTTIMLVSWHYSAPERPRGHSSVASDVYSLAAIAFEMLTGTRFATLVNGDEKELRRDLAGYSNDVVRLLVQGTQAAPSARPQDIREFADMLAKSIEDCQQRPSV